MALEVIAFVRHDCPVCDQVLPALDAAGGAPGVAVPRLEETAAQARAAGALSRVPETDLELDAVGRRFDPAAVPAVLLLDDGVERDRVEGLARDRMAALVAEAGGTLRVDGLPAMRPACGSVTRDPEIAARLAARRARADGRIVARELSIGELEDPFEALHERGLTDGLPVVLLTPELVVAMLEYTSRHPQDLVGRGAALRRRAPASRRWRSTR